jgi:TatD DNase family protein
VRAALGWEECLIDTDAPFLVPVPHRGKRNEPAWVAQVAALLGELKGISAEDAAAKTAQNFRKFFGFA